LIFTGCRRNEALTATWSDIDFGKSMWNRPAIRQKGKKHHSVPLAPQAAALLLGIRNRQVADGIFKPDGYVFPSSTSKTGHVIRPQSMGAGVARRRHRQHGAAFPAPSMIGCVVA
jgi:integrase